MARGATVVQFEIELSDVDRGVYESLRLSAAQHPSESGPYLTARVLAYTLEACEGLAFTQGLSSGDEPALQVRDLTGQLLQWIEVGTPDGPRLHKASKAAGRVAVYCHKEPAPWLKGLAKERVHRAEEIELFGLDPSAVNALADGLERRNVWSLSRIDGVVYVQAGDHNYEVAVRSLPWPQG